jgi:IS5 family transposase
MEHDLVQVLDGVVDKAFDFLSLGVCRGRPRIFPAKSMVKAFLVMLFKGLTSELDLLRFLEANPRLASEIGFPKLPHRTTLLRFRRSHATLLIKLVEELRKQLPQTDIYGIDATLEWKNDPDACWGMSPSKGWVYGFKFHVFSNLQVGLPVRVLVTPANKHDSPMLPKLVSGIGVCDYVADKGYDSEDNHQVIHREGGFPAICRNKRRGKPRGRTLRNMLQGSSRRKRLLKKRWKVEPINEHFKSILQLPRRLFHGIKSVIFYAQLTLLRLLTQAVWAYQIGKPHLARVTTHFKHR